MDQISYFNKTVASKNMSGYYLLKNGEYAYNKSYSVGYDFGSVKRLDRYDMGALSTLYICFALKKHDSDFIKAYFDSLKWYREIYMISAEGARNHGLLNVPTDEFFDTKHYIPQDLTEQRKIANFMIVLERRIVAQQSLVDNLKKYKRGLSNSLFDRLSAGSESRLCIFGDMMTILQNNTFSRDNLSVGGNGVRNIHYGDVLIKYGAVLDLHSENVPVINAEQDISKFSALSYLRNGDVVFADTAEDYTVGKSTEIIGAENIAALSGLHTIPCRPQDSFAPMYLGYYFNSDYFKKQLYPMIQGTKVSSISKSEIIKTKIIVPCLQEQARIASIMSALDDRIDAAKHTTKDLIDLRSGLLQQLFI